MLAFVKSMRCLMGASGAAGGEYVDCKIEKNMCKMVLCFLEFGDVFR